MPAVRSESRHFWSAAVARARFRLVVATSRWWRWGTHRICPGTRARPHARDRPLAKRGERSRRRTTGHGGPTPATTAGRTRGLEENRLSISPGDGALCRLPDEREFPATHMSA